MSEFEHTRISILGEEVEATPDRLPIDSLQFLPDNPRVYAAVRKITGFDKLTDEEKQPKIFEQLLNEPSVKNLRPEIERDEGLQEPILVRHDTKQVIEGNSRLAIYRQLNAENPEDERWQSIRCLVVGTLRPEQQVRVLGQAHLRGKTDWSSYAQALFCYRWVVELQNLPEELSEISGFTVQFIKKQVAIVKLMKENGDEVESHYSSYNVLLTSKKISAAVTRTDANKLRNVVLDGIKNENFTAQQLREWLPVVLAKTKVTKKFASGSISLRVAHERAEVSATKNHFDRILGLLDAIETREFSNLNYAEIRTVKQVARKVNNKAKRLLDAVEQRVDETGTKKRQKRSYVSKTTASHHLAT